MYILIKCIIVGRCAFGIETDMQNDIDNMFLQKAQLTIDLNPDHLMLIKLANLFPFLGPLVRCIIIGQMIFIYLFRKIAPTWFLSQIQELAPFWILNRVEQVINTRTASELSQNQSHPVDLLQLMLDASTTNAIEVISYHTY